eukprot:3145244-Rhodomonas_salina.1
MDGWMEGWMDGWMDGWREGGRAGGENREREEEEKRERTSVIARHSATHTSTLSAPRRRARVDEHVVCVCVCVCVGGGGVGGGYEVDEGELAGVFALLLELDLHPAQDANVSAGREHGPAYWVGWKEAQREQRMRKKRSRNARERASQRAAEAFENARAATMGRGRTKTLKKEEDSTRNTTHATAQQCPTQTCTGVHSCAMPGAAVHRLALPSTANGAEARADLQHSVGAGGVHVGACRRR